MVLVCIYDVYDMYAMYGYDECITNQDSWAVWILQIELLKTRFKCAFSTLLKPDVQPHLGTFEPNLAVPSLFSLSYFAPALFVLFLLVTTLDK